MEEQNPSQPILTGLWEDRWSSRSGKCTRKDYSCDWISESLAGVNFDKQVSYQDFVHWTDTHGIRGAAKVVTLEYGSFKSEYPTHEFIRPNEFRERYLAGTLDEFDAIFTYSSVEHSGLGMYLYVPEYSHFRFIFFLFLISLLVTLFPFIK